MKFLPALLFSALLLVSASASLTIDEKGYTDKNGFQTSFNAQTWMNGDDITSVWGPSKGVYQEGAAGQQIVTGPGRSSLEISGEMTGGYEQHTTLTSKGPAAAWDSLSMNSLIPNESEIECTASEVVYYGEKVTSGATPSHAQADGQTGIMGNGTYESDKVMTGDSYGLSGRADVNGTFYGDFSATSETGKDKDDTTQNHEDSVYRHVLKASSGKVSGSVDWIWDDVSDQPVAATNETAANETETNSSVEGA